MLNVSDVFRLQLLHSKELKNDQYTRNYNLFDAWNRHGVAYPKRIYTMKVNGDAVKEAADRASKHTEKLKEILCWHPTCMKTDCKHHGDRPHNYCCHCGKKNRKYKGVLDMCPNRLLHQAAVSRVTARYETRGFMKLAHSQVRKSKR